MSRYMSSYILVVVLVTVITICTRIVLANAQWDEFMGVDQSGGNKKIVVDQSGRGDFNSIQSAVNSIPSNNANWITIYVKAGIYKEKVDIPAEKTFVILQGEGMDGTRIVWNDYYGVTDKSATFNVEADNFIAIDISFVNSHDYPTLAKQGQWDRAEAARISGDKSIFYNCGFYGFQDTLWDVTGRHFFKNCQIEGAVDFIFGAGQSIYDNCNITVNGDQLGGKLAGFITAQGRENQNDDNGFVFRMCTVNGTGLTYLGRAWRRYSRVLFYKTYLPSIVVPEGWEAWRAAGSESLVTYVEDKCYGPGADMSHRVGWMEHDFDRRELNRLVTIEYIDDDGWTKAYR